MDKKVIIGIVTFVILSALLFAFSNKTPESKCVAGETCETTIEKGFKGSVSPSKFSELIETGDYIVIDIRTQAEYNVSHITDNPELMDFYMSDFKTKIATLDKSEKYLIYCNSGNRSSSAVDIMEDLGFKDFYELKGGIQAWIGEGLEVK